MSREFPIRPTVQGEEVALLSDLGGGGPHDHDHIVPLSEDAFDEADPITDYPSGVSIMPISDTAIWNEGWDEAGVVVTYRGGGIGSQHLVFGESSANFWRYYYDTGVLSGWTPSWFDYATAEQIPTEFTNLSPLPEDYKAEADPITDYPSGASIMPVSDTADWDGSDEAAVVRTERSNTRGWQEIAWSVGEVRKYRFFEPDLLTWGAWDSYLSFSLALAEFVATTDYEDSDVLNKIKNVDGSGSGLDSDTVDGQHASAFLTSAFYQTVKEGGTARTQRAAINFGNGLDAVDDSGNNETDVSVDESELTHNSLGGLTTGDPHTQYQLETENGAASGYASLDGSTKVPSAQLPAASETVVGSAELATQAETDTGTDDARIVTPLKLKTTTALDSRYYTETEVDTALSGKVSTTRTISTTAPLTGGGDLSANRTLSVSTATETAEGVSERATQAETNTGTDDVRYVSPAKLANYTGITNKALASDLSDHLADTSDAHDASAISVLDTATQYTANNVEDALAEVLDALQAHEADTSDAHDASAISYAGGTGMSATDVEAAIDELATEKVDTTRTISTTAPLTGGGDLSANRTLAVSAASETASGVVELATDAETQTGTDTARAITPANLAARTATETRTGVVELATDAETQTGTDTARAITPANLSARSATETRTGVAELATQAEVNTGTDDARIVTPLKLKTNVDLHINDTSAAHAASAISYAGSTNLSSTDVEAALDELDTEKASTGSVTTVQTNLDNHLNDTTDAHDASAISFSPTGTVASTDVQSAIAEVASEAAGFNLTEVEVDLGSTLQTSGNFVISGLSGLNTGDPVLVRQAVGPYTNKGTLADEFEMDTVNVAGKVASASTIQCYWSTDSFVRGNFKFLYAVG